MGCNCSRNDRKVVVSQKIPSLNTNKFKIKIYLPNREHKTLSHEAKNEYILLIDLFNTIFFIEDKDYDANFISKYIPEKDEFEYYIQRILGVQIENEYDPHHGKMWVVYINQVAYDWTFLCSRNRILNKDDDVELKFEYFTTTSKN